MQHGECLSTEKEETIDAIAGCLACIASAVCSHLLAMHNMRHDVC
jgi:hypothetical protein